MITHKPFDNGYEFYYNGRMIAVGVYGQDGFEVCENDDVSVHTNGMQAMMFLRKKYTPEFYMTLPKYDFTKPFRHPNGRLSEVFKSHPALKGVHPLANEMRSN